MWEIVNKRIESKLTYLPIIRNLLKDIDNVQSKVADFYT